MKAIFFDAAGTLFELNGSVGHHYATVANRIGLAWEADALDAAFVRSWREMRARPATGRPRDDDDKPWWRELVGHVIDQVAPATRELDRDNFFEIAYEHFAEAGVWRLYPEVLEVLGQLEPHFHLAIVSNFDGRLRMILETLGVAKFFRHVCLSSELGADKPDPLIYRRALELVGVPAADALHVGDDPVRDWRGAAAAGLKFFPLDRPRNSLRGLLIDPHLCGTDSLRAPSN
ncbi:MAG: HAD-IA family hydrolase [Verrucomicrobiota bacterium]|nr:HAD-IA family hydrolase [Verrucomicrobiota bacterium]